MTVENIDQAKAEAFAERLVDLLNRPNAWVHVTSRRVEHEYELQIASRRLSTCRVYFSEAGRIFTHRSECLYEIWFA